MNKRIICLLICYVWINNLWAQAETKGTIVGKVVEAESGFMIIGASIFLHEKGIGTSSDLDGAFQLRNLAPGTYSLDCAYLGFAKSSVKNIVVAAGEVVTIDFSLKEEDMEIKENVEVEGRLVRNTETSLLTIKRQSAAILDGVSATQIKKTGDNDAALSMRRITGVTVEAGKYIYVRGLGDRYSKTTLNGADVPGLDPNRNTVQMDLFPSSLLDNILVYKTFTPNLYGDFTGGYIDIETKDFPEILTFNVVGSIAYNSINTFNPNINSYKGGKLDWLGFDDGSRQLPSIAANAQPFPNFRTSNSTTFNAIEAQTLEDVTKSFANNWSFNNQARPFNHNLSVSLGNQTKIFRRTFGFIAALTYQRQFTGYNQGRYGIYELSDNVNNTDFLTPQLTLKENIGVDDVLWGAMFSGNLKFDDNNKIGFTVLRNQSGSASARYSRGQKPRDDPDDIFITQSWSYLQRSLSNYQLRGKHVIEKWNDFEIKWQSAYSISTQNEPDLRYFTYRLQPDGSFDIKTSDNPPSRFYRDMQQGNFSNRIDFSQPFNQWNQLSAKLQFGAAYVLKNRVFNEKRYVFSEAGVVDFNGNTADYFSMTNMVDYLPSEGRWANNDRGLYAQPGVDLRNSYEANQAVAAGYLMLDMPLSKNLRFVGGLRVEHTNLTLLSLDPILQNNDSLPLDGQYKLLNNLDFLPSVAFNYELNKTMKLRAAYSRTLARPTFRELAPFTSFDVDGGYLLAGNPNLKRSLIDNFDLRYEIFPSFAELISIGGFFKRMQNPIERTFNPTAPNSEITFRNVKGAILFGAEFEIAKNLGFIAKAMKNFSLAANFAYIYSRTNIDLQELNEIRANDPSASAFRSMFGQSPFSTNILLSYQNEKGTSFNVVFNVIGSRISLIMRGATPDVYERPVPLLGVNFSQEFAKYFSLTIRANNLLNSQYRESIQFKASEYFVQSRPIGMTFSLGIGYQFKGKGRSNR